eukprot:s193_g21.t1
MIPICLQKVQESDSRWRDFPLSNARDREGETIGDTAALVLELHYTNEEMLDRRVCRNGAFFRCVGAAPSPHAIIRIIRIIDQWLGSKQKRLKDVDRMSPHGVLAPYADPRKQQVATKVGLSATFSNCGPSTKRVTVFSEVQPKQGNCKGLKNCLDLNMIVASWVGK